MRPSKTSISGDRPVGADQRGAASTSTIGSRRRAAAMASPSRVCAFSRTRSSSSFGLPGGPVDHLGDLRFVAHVDRSFRVRRRPARPRRRARGCDPSSTLAAAAPSAATAIATAKADWNPSVRAASDPAPCAPDTATVDRIAVPDRAADLEGGVVEPRGEAGFGLGHSGQRRDRARDEGGADARAEEQQREQQVAEVGAVDRHLRQQQAAQAGERQAGDRDRPHAAPGRERLRAERCRSPP